MKKIFKNKKAITLIALVITIIVLVILASVAINLSLGNNGIFNKAKQARNNYMLATNQEQEELANININNLVDDENSLKKWYYDDNKNITNGIITLKIGDYIDYNPVPEDYDENTNPYTDQINFTSPVGVDCENYGYISATVATQEGSGRSSEQRFSAISYSGKWRVLGVEDGNILIMCEDPIKPIGKSHFYMYGITGVKYAKQQLDKICRIFQYGKGAKRARSITVEDINKITGYNPNNVGVYDPEQIGIGKKYNQDKSGEYGVMCSYYWGTTQGYRTVNYGNKVGMIKNQSSYLDKYIDYGFNYYDQTNGWISVPVDVSDSDDNLKHICDITSTYYVYYSSTLTSFTNNEVVGIEKTSPEYNMIFKDSSGKSKGYILNSNCVYTGDWPCYGMFVVMPDECVNVSNMYYSYGKSNPGGSAVCPVVYLDDNISLQSNGDNNWIII